MWLITKFGFFSVVHKAPDIRARTLSVRTRVKGDLESLRAYIPDMGTIAATKDAD